MKHFQSIQARDKSAFDALYTGATQEEIGQQIESLFAREGYSIKSGEIGNRTYVKGNRVLRLLLGAFYKYFEFHVGIRNADENNVVASITKTTSGMSGGVIGMSQVKTELIRLESVMSEV